MKNLIKSTGPSRSGYLLDPTSDYWYFAGHVFPFHVDNDPGSAPGGTLLLPFGRGG